MRSSKFYFVFLILLSVVCAAQSTRRPLKIPAVRHDLYPADANAHEELQRALAAAAPNKRVILVFGANWCSDCFALDYAFHQPRIEPILKANYKVVHINTGGTEGTFDKNLDLIKKYKIPIQKGVPSLAVIDARDNLLYSTPEFEKARRMTEEDVIEFLNKWKPPAVHAKK
jgi:thioredoxin 1